jgi:phage terminase large subunit
MAKEIDIHLEVFNPVYVPHLQNGARTQIFYGGAGSGKSVFLAQRCVMDILQGGRNYLITRAVARTIRGSVFNEICRVINGWGLDGLFTINKTDMLITCSNGYQIIFAGLDDSEKLKSIIPAKGVLTDIWIEEATETDRMTVKALYKRQRGGSSSIAKRMILSFNPILQSHWIYEEYFSKIAWRDNQTEYISEDISIQKTWYIHNKFLTPDDVRDLENETDKYYYNVYTLGNWGILGNVIFTNWRVEDLSSMREQFTNTRNGLDFGFSSDPAALSRSHYDRVRKTIYFFDEVYETGLTNPMLAGVLKPLINTERVVCDSAEPKSIQELRDNGINATPARKGKDSVNFGIQWLQQQTLVIDTSCINTRNEIQQYKWKEDKNGLAIRQPVEHNNHLIDATRYAYEDDTHERPVARSYQG